MEWEIWQTIALVMLDMEVQNLEGVNQHLAGKFDLREYEMMLYGQGSISSVVGK